MYEGIVKKYSLQKDKNFSNALYLLAAVPCHFNRQHNLQTRVEEGVLLSVRAVMPGHLFKYAVAFPT